MRIGVLRLIDQDMLGHLVELVADPFADAGPLQQLDGGADQVVEIDRPDRALGQGIGARIVTPHGQRIGEQIGMTRPRGQAEEVAARLSQFARHVLIIGIGVGQLLGCLARLALGGEDRAHQLFEHGHPPRPVAADPALQHRRCLVAGRGAPGAVRPRQPDDRVLVDFLDTLGNRLVDIARGQVERAAEPGLDARGQRLQRTRRTGAGGEEGFRPALAQPQRECADRLDRADTALALGGFEHPGQRLARQHRFLARLQRAKARRKARLDREGRKQPLAEAVDGLDAKPTARRVEHACEQRPRPVAQVGRRRLAQRLQVAEQLGLGHPHPGGETAIDPLRHLGGACLGEGQTQYRLGRNTR